LRSRTCIRPPASDSSPPLLHQAAGERQQSAADECRRCPRPAKFQHDAPGKALIVAKQNSRQFAEIRFDAARGEADQEAADRQQYQ
jgi:hypothetical protein